MNRIRPETELERFWTGTVADGFLIQAGDRGNLKQGRILRPKKYLSRLLVLRYWQPIARS